MTLRTTTTKEYNHKDLLRDSYEGRIGHIPSALSLMRITKKLRGLDNPIVVGKSFGVQAWFFDESVRQSFLGSKRRVLTTEDFDGSSLRVVYCQQQLGLAAGFAVGYSSSHREETTLCLLSDGDVLMKSSLDAINLAFRMKLPIKFIVDYNRVQLFGDKDCYDALRHLRPSLDEIRTDASTEIILVRTKKGEGVPSMERRPKEWHYTILSDEMYKSLLSET